MYTAMPQWGQALQSNTWQQPQQGAMPDQQAMPQQAMPSFGYSPTPLSQFGWQAMMGGIAPWMQRYMPQQGMPQQAAAPAQQNDRFMRKWNRNPNQTVERFVNDPRFGQQVRNNPQQMQAMWGLLNNRPPPGTQAYVQQPEGGWNSSWADYLHMSAPQAAIMQDRPSTTLPTQPPQSVPPIFEHGGVAGPLGSPTPLPGSEYWAY